MFCAFRFCLTLRMSNYSSKCSPNMRKMMNLIDTVALKATTRHLEEWMKKKWGWTPTAGTRSNAVSHLVSCHRLVIALETSSCSVCVCVCYHSCAARATLSLRANWKVQSKFFRPCHILPCWLHKAHWMHVIKWEYYEHLAKPGSLDVEIVVRYPAKAGLHH